jgi:hypothetical protein
MPLVPSTPGEDPAEGFLTRAVLPSGSAALRGARSSPWYYPGTKDGQLRARSASECMAGPPRNSLAGASSLYDYLPCRRNILRTPRRSQGFTLGWALGANLGGPCKEGWLSLAFARESAGLACNGWAAHRWAGALYPETVHQNRRGGSPCLRPWGGGVPLLRKGNIGRKPRGISVHQDRWNQPGAKWMPALTEKGPVGKGWPP